MFVLHNPHSFDMLFTPFSYFLVRKKAHLKYEYLINHLFKDGTVYIVVDYSESSLLSGRTLIKIPYFLRVILIRTELFFWKKINKDSKFKII
jgi:hypothetical protein